MGGSVNEERKTETFGDMVFLMAARQAPARTVIKSGTLSLNMNLTIVSTLSSDHHYTV